MQANRCRSLVAQPLASIHGFRKVADTGLVAALPLSQPAGPKQQP
jgi:hypothetical protein